MMMPSMMGASPRNALAARVPEEGASRPPMPAAPAPENTLMGRVSQPLPLRPQGLQLPFSQIGAPPVRTSVRSPLDV